MPYRLIMVKLSKLPPIPGLNAPGRIESIVHELFPHHPSKIKEHWPTECRIEAEKYEITTSELTTTARLIKRNIAPGPDEITNEILKTIIRCQPEPLVKVFKKCLEEGHFPISWQVARLMLRRERDKPTKLPYSYRALCLLSCTGKLLEKLLDNRLRKFLDDSVGLDKRQYRFRKGHSKIDPVHKLREIVELSGPRKKIGILTLDIQNAFNSDPWEGIMKATEEKKFQCI